VTKEGNMEKERRWEGGGRGPSAHSSVFCVEGLKEDLQRSNHKVVSFQSS